MPSAIENFSSSREISSKINPESLSSVIERSIFTIILHQHPETGLFPAATKERYNREGHYDHSWVRDNARIVLALNNPMVRALYPQGSEIGNQLNETTGKWIQGVFRLITQPEWQNGFSQQVYRASIPEAPGQEYTFLENLTKAPPIHCQVNGSPCEWPTQNQPDAWGLFLSAVTLGSRQSQISLNQKEKELFTSVIDYLVRLEPEHVQASSIWEGWLTCNPTPLSTVAICAKGLKDAIPFAPSRLKNPLKARIAKAGEIIENNYPTDYTMPANHAGKSDLATLFALAIDALNSVSPYQYFNLANQELGNGPLGKKRFIGDDYYKAYDSEATWFMAMPLEATIFLKRALALQSSRFLASAQRLKTKGLVKLVEALNIHEQYGFYPELFVQTKDGIRPPEGTNDLLWNHAEMIQAAALAHQAIF